MMPIDKNVVMLGFVSFFTDLTSAMINPILPIFVIIVLHEGMDKLGIIVAISTFVSYALRLLFGYISDRYGIVKPLVVGGYALSAITKPLLGLTHGYKSIAGLRACERVGKSMRSAPRDLMISHYSSQNNSGKTFGFHKTLDIAGELSGTIILFVLLYYFGQSENVIRNIFYITLIPGLIGVFIVLFFVQDIPKTVNLKKNGLKLTDNDKKTIKSFFLYFLFVFFIFSDAFFTMQAKSIGLVTTVIPLLFIVSTATQTLTSYIFGLWIDKIGTEKIMIFAFGCGVIAQMCLYIQSPIFTWFAYAFLGLFTVASLNSNRSYISQTADNKGSVYGIFYAGVAIFSALGAYTWGMVWENIGMDRALEYSLIGVGGVSILFFIKIRVKNG